MTAGMAIWAIVALATGGVILRPWQLPEAVFATLGAVALVAFGLLSVTDAWIGIRRGFDVYLFLIGMMLLAELARGQGLFDWLATLAARAAAGSAIRLFTLVYLVGVVVTVFLSNDATAVVLTPAVAAVARTVRAEKPMPYLLVCAFVANAASFVLPISNPANLVIYGAHMPSLLDWLARFSWPSLLAIVSTYVVLLLTQRQALRLPIAGDVVMADLSPGGRAAGFGIVATALALMAASAFDLPLGLATCIAGTITAICVLVLARQTPWPVLGGVAWGVLPLVAGLFVLVEALDRIGAIRALSETLRQFAATSVTGTAWASGTIVALACNLLNNLPAGLVAGTAVQAAQTPPAVTGAILIGVDLGPNLSVTGSLATILWLGALRRDGLGIDAWQFLKLGALVMPPALVLALGALIWLG